MLKNDTWELVPPSSTQNLVGSKWIFHIKRKPDGTIDHYKAKLVAKGYHQRPGIDFYKKFSLVVKQASIRLILSMAISFKWDIHEFDVSNAFLHGALDEDVFMQQP